MPTVVLEGGMIFSIRTLLRVGIKRLAIWVSENIGATGFTTWGKRTTAAC